MAFIDRVQESQPPHLKEKYGPINSSNPCGEEFTEDKNSCNLGSINLYKHFDEDTGDVDWRLLEQNVRLATRFLDNVIDVNWFPFEKQRQMNLETRRIGLGVMGWADLCVMLKIPYNSQEACDLASTLSERITNWAYDESLAIGAEKGAVTPDGARNSSLTTIAPTGSISIIAGCSSGIEPFFALFWTRKSMWSAVRDPARARPP